MREIKFRAWDYTNQRMFQQAFDMGEGIVLFITDPRVKSDELLWLQYTGRKDKAGTEIYEGDIIERQQYATTYDGRKKPNGVSRTVVKWVETAVYTGFNLSRTESCKVIGNIHENPELLEKSK